MKKSLVFVITAEPERPQSTYWDANVRKTMLPLAKTFYSWDEAKEFADQNGIVIDGVMNTIVVQP